MSFGYGWRGPNIVKDGLVLYLDPGSPNSYYNKSGTTINDISSNGNNGTLANGPIYNTSNGGNLVFDGTNNYVDLLSNGNNTVFSSQTFTIDFWYKTDFTGAPYDVLWSYDYISHAPPYYAQHLRIDSSPSRQTIIFGYNINGTYNFIAAPISSITTGTWYNIVVSISTTTRDMYINSTSVASSTMNGNINYYNQPIYIGKCNFATGIIKGNIGSVKFYNRTLSAQEVLQNYNATKTRFGL